LELSNLVDEDTKCIQNDRKKHISDKVSHSRGPESSTEVLWKCQTLQEKGNLSGPTVIPNIYLPNRLFV